MGSGLATMIFDTHTVMVGGATGPVARPEVFAQRRVEQGYPAEESGGLQFAQAAT